MSKPGSMELKATCARMNNADHILLLFLGQTSKLLALGLTLGTLFAILSGRFISTVVFGISPQDPGTLIGSTLVLIGVAILATYLPVRHAALLNPTVTLRHE